MSSGEFIAVLKQLVAEYVNKHIDKSDEVQISPDDVYVVWSVKVLQNNKAMVSTPLSDGMYYEVTYNGDKDEMYIDVYKKWENICVYDVNADGDKE